MGQQPIWSMPASALGELLSLLNGDEDDARVIDDLLVQLEDARIRPARYVRLGHCSFWVDAASGNALAGVRGWRRK